MPTLQQKDLIEKYMNIHWDRVEKQKAVVDNTWNRKTIGIRRKPHHLLNDKRIEKDNMKLYKKLSDIQTGRKSSILAKEMTGSYDPKFVQKLCTARKWHRDHAREDKQRVIDNENKTLFRALRNSTSMVPSAESLAKEYEHNHKIVDALKVNNVKPSELHLCIRRRARGNDKERNSGQHILGAFLKSSLDKPTESSKRRNKRASSEGHMPSKLRRAVRPKSACDTRCAPKYTSALTAGMKRPHSGKLLSKGEVLNMYQELSKQKAVSHSKSRDKDLNAR